MRWPNGDKSLYFIRYVATHQLKKFYCGQSSSNATPVGELDESEQALTQNMPMNISTSLAELNLE